MPTPHITIARPAFMATEYAVTNEHGGWVLWRRPPGRKEWMIVDATDRDEIVTRWADRIRAAWGVLIRWATPGIPPHGGAR